MIPMKKKMFACFLSAALVLQGCGIAGTNANANGNVGSETAATDQAPALTKKGEFSSLSDEELRPYLENNIYDDLIDQIGQNYLVQNIETVYVSQEYLDELAFNSEANIYFGYTLAELEDQFEGQKYVYTVSDDGQTIVKVFEGQDDDAFNTVVKNIAVGSGVILVCVTVSALAATSAPAVSMVFAVAAKTGTEAALSGGAISALTAGAAKAIETGGNMDEALKSAVVAGSEGFKWGAIGGCLTGGAKETAGLKWATKSGLKMNEAATIQRESKYPLDVIRNIKSMDEYSVYKSAGLEAKAVGNKAALVQEIDLSRVDEKGMTNLQRMEKGKPPLDADGKEYELHHLNQENEGTLAVLTQEQHRGKGLFSVLHDKWTDGAVGHGADWAKTKKEFWQNLAELMKNGAV